MSICGALSPIPSDGLPSGTCNVVACVDRSGRADTVVPHAFAIARALGAPVTLLQVLEPQAIQNSRPDPIEWDLRRHDARRLLGQLASAPPTSSQKAAVALAEGRTAEEICRFASGKEDGLIVLGTRGDSAATSGGIGGTVHNVLSQASGSILLVPTGARGPTTADYRRIIVPVDGSPWAESVLPLAARLARAADAELILAHVVPTPELTETRPLEPEDLQLRQRVVERNAEIARAYLERTRSYLTAMGLRVRIVAAEGDDVRATLAGLINTERADLVVLSARGHGGSRQSDMRYGSVTSYLISHAAAPMLIVRPTSIRVEPTATQNSQGGRLPALCSA